MSERPNDRNPQDKERRSGWRIPENTGGRSQPLIQQPSTPPSKAADWQVPVLPRELSVEPQVRGAWHLPRPEDTTYTPEDVTLIPADDAQTEGITDQSNLNLLRLDEGGEDAGLETPLPFDGDDSGVIARAAVATPLQEDTRLAAAEQARADRVAEALSLLEDDDDDGDDVSNSFSMSELIALASLETARSTSELTPASDAPAENVYDASDPVSYARRQLELLQQQAAKAQNQLEQLNEPETTNADMETAQDANSAVSVELDPAEYARQQMARLQQGQMPPAATPAPVTPEAAAPAPEAAAPAPAPAPAQVDSQPLPDATSVLTPEEQALAQRYRTAEATVRDLRRMYQNGQLSREDFENGLRQSMVLDDNRIYWMLGTESDRWYKHENNEWTPATPPVLEKEAPGAGGAVDFDHTVPTATISDEGWVPQRVPVRDMDATVPNTAGIFIDRNNQPTVPGATYTEATVPNDPYSQATVPGTAYSQATVPGQAYNQPTIANQPFDMGASVAADAADADESLYEQAVERQRQDTARTLAIGAALIAAAIFLIGTISVIIAVTSYNNLADPYRQQVIALANYTPLFQTARIYAADNSLIAELTSEQGGARTRVPLERIAPELIHAVVSLENERFFEDPGFDVLAIGRAFFQNLTSGQIDSGASTITQQIARNLILQDTTVSPQRKLQEIVIAAEIARTYDKDFILALYLNEVYFGNQSYGVEAAAQFYFKHSAEDVNLPEAALLAGLIQAPALYDPVINRTAAFGQMREVLVRMATVGCLNFQHAPYNTSPYCISTQQIDQNATPGTAIQIARIESANYLPRATRVLYPHFVNYIQQQIEANFGTSEMFRRGFNIYTTLVPRIQDGAQDILARQAQSLSPNSINAGTVMVTDPNDGAIRAMVGSPDFNSEANSGQINYALTWQQPGSAIKPVVYAAALEGSDVNGVRNYYTPATILWDVPVRYTNPDYAPVNFDGIFHGPQALRYALANSYNIPAVKTYESIGSARFQETAQRMGLRFLDNASFGLATALGGTEVRLYDMMQAYGTIASGGQRVPLYAITRIGTSEAEDIPVPERAAATTALQPSVAFLLQNILSDNSARAAAFGAGSPLLIEGYQNQVAAKTGTSNSNRDLWTMGFSRNYVVGVWLGRNDDAPTVNTTQLSAAPIWNAVMRIVLQSTQPGAFTVPDGVVQQQVCAETGTLFDANVTPPGCRSIRTEYFIANSPPPTASQSFVQTVPVDSWSNLRANNFCPDFQVPGTFANIGDASAVAWLNTAPGQQYARSIGLPVPLTAPPTAECDQNTINPQLSFSNIGNNQQVTGEVQIQGVATGNNFQSYRLDLAPAGAPTNFVSIAGPFTAAQSNGVLATWNSTTVQSGNYVLRLIATSTTGGIASRTVNITVFNQPTPVPPTPIPTIVIPPTLDINSTPLPFPTPTATLMAG